jgi:hypothetical protein
MEVIEELTREEGLLLALYLLDGEVLGKVRLNKLLARLQHDGFPIINHFTNLQMGPQDREIDLDSIRLDEGGFISRYKTPRPNYENPRIDYRLTDTGALWVEQEILPKVKRNPFYRDFTNSFGSVKYEYKSMKIDDLYKKVHVDLCISDDINRFLVETIDTKEALTNQFNKIKSDGMNYCYADLVLLGSTEFAIRCLDIIQKRDIDDQATGKNNILAQSKQLSSNIELFQSNFRASNKDCSDFKKCLRGINCVIDKLNPIKYALHCIEWNAETYQILKPFGDDFDLADYMTDEEESLFTSHPQTMSTMV